MIIDATGRVDAARFAASPNCDQRPAGEVPTLLIIHNISLPPGQFSGDAVERLFANTLDSRAHPYFATMADLRVSAHFLVRRGGELLQFVPCAQRAWHAGASAWRGRERCNDFYIGIELEGTDDICFEDEQYDKLGKLSRLLHQDYKIEHRVINNLEPVAVSKKEQKYILHHELFELSLMEKGKSYNNAHDFANAAEKELRRNDKVTKYIKD